jgi:hypothetical protein
MRSSNSGSIGVTGKAFDALVRRARERLYGSPGDLGTEVIGHSIGH